MHRVTLPMPEGTLYGDNRTIKGHAYTTQTVRALLNLEFSNGAKTERMGAAAILRANPHWFQSEQHMERALAAIEARGTDHKD